MPTTRSTSGRRSTVSSRTLVPSLRAERGYWDAGAQWVCGIDEVGRGAWAGPVTVGAVIVPRDRRLYGLRDSKLLSLERREELAPRIHEWALAVGIGHASPQECDAMGMTAALKQAAVRAVAAIVAQGFEPDRILLDGNHDYLGYGRARVETIIKGDQSSLTIAAASIVAKVARDRLMAEEAEHFPAFGFEHNRGYPAPVHKVALDGYGPTTIHRRSWVFMDNLPWFEPVEAPSDASQPTLF